MRIPRSLQLYPEKASIHLFWRCHNKEYYLAEARNKSMYMQTIHESLENKNIIYHEKLFYLKNK